MRIVLIVVVVALVLVPFGLSGKPQPLAFSSVAKQTQSVVEQQSNWAACTNGDETACVYDRTGCVWDYDEFELRGPYGYLDAGASVTDSLCLVADEVGDPGHGGYGEHLTTVLIRADRPTLEITLAFDPSCFCSSPWGPVGDATFSAATFSSVYGLWQYKGCVIAPWYSPDDLRRVPIPESNGGTGVFTTATLTVRNIGTRRISKTGGEWGIRSNFFTGNGCGSWND